MSWKRIVLIALLSLMLAGIVFMGAVQWMRSFPSYHFSKAEQAVEEENYDAAKLHLLKLVHRHPDNAAGHEFLSRVILEHSRAQNRSASFAANPAAIEYLARAVELEPTNAQWRRRLLQAYLQSRQITKAAQVAAVIYAEDKTDGDAHLALTWHAVAANNAEEAERLFAETEGVVSRHILTEFARKLTY